jgi:hypothetical protein
MDIKKIIREEIDSDWDWLDDVDYMDLTNIDEGDLKNMLETSDLIINDEGDYTLTLNKQKYIEMYPNNIDDQDLPIFLCWEGHTETFISQPNGCVGYSYEEALRGFKVNGWEVVDIG